jgi:hypothetical protein
MSAVRDNIIGCYSIADRYPAHFDSLSDAVAALQYSISIAVATETSPAVDGLPVTTISNSLLNTDEIGTIFYQGKWMFFLRFFVQNPNKKSQKNMIKTS